MAAMVERALVLIKPDHVEFADEILRELDNHGSRAATSRVFSVPGNVIRAHYSPHNGKPFFGYMTGSFIGKPVVLAVYKGEGIIQKLIDVIGPTDPSKASEDTIRGKYSKDSLEKAIAEGRPVRNVVHRSDSVEEAERELRVWMDYL